MAPFYSLVLLGCGEIVAEQNPDGALQAGEDGDVAVGVDGAPSIDSGASLAADAAVGADGGASACSTILAIQSERDDGNFLDNIGLWRPGDDQVRYVSDADVDDAHPSWLPDGSGLVYSGEPNDPSVSRQIYRVSIDTGEIEQLTANSNGNFWPEPAPDGSEIAWLGLVNDELWRMDADGTDQKAITERSVSVLGRPNWSSDSSRIAFAAAPSDGEVDVFSIAPDGTAFVNLSNSSSSSDGTPDWSPSGDKIAFGSDREGSDDIFVMNADGSSPVQLTDAAGDESCPAWSPDGSRIAFHCEADDTGAELCVMNADGTGLFRLAAMPSGGGCSTTPSWSPDGALIAFEGPEGLAVVSRQGGEVTLVPAFNPRPDAQWGPCTADYPPET